MAGILKAMGCIEILQGANLALHPVSFLTGWGFTDSAGDDVVDLFVRCWGLTSFTVGGLQLCIAQGDDKDTRKSALRYVMLPSMSLWLVMTKYTSDVLAKRPGYSRLQMGAGYFLVAAQLAAVAWEAGLRELMGFGGDDDDEAKAAPQGQPPRLR